MSERPILFSGPMVRAIIEGRKTQTRRISTVSSLEISKNGIMRYSFTKATKGVLAGTSGVHRAAMDDFVDRFCPYGKPGDQLWVRETFRLFDSSTECACYEECRCAKYHGKPIYRATDDGADGPWKPSIFMRREHSRITLEITGVRVERLQDITEADAKAEGANRCAEPCLHYGYRYREGYFDLWESINGPGSWGANPWVWVVEFRAIGKEEA